MVKKKSVLPAILYSIALLISVLRPDLVNARISTSESDTTREDAMRLFIDCPSGCDLNYIRDKIPYVNYVRDVHEAQLYLLITMQSTGGGGKSFSLFFSGQREFSGMKDTLNFYSNPDDTRDEIRAGLTNTIALGLIRYVAKTAFRNRVQISYSGESREEAELISDKWNYWVFQIDISPNLRLEQKNKEYSWDAEIDCDRITSGWKLENEFSYDYEFEVFIRDKYDDATGEYREIRTDAVRKSWNYVNLTVKSLNNHWSAGIWTSVQSSSYRNINFSTTFVPAIEYNIFPYSEYNQRQLTFLFGLGYVYNNYVDMTVYNKMKETLFQQWLNIKLKVQQKWGSSEISMNASSFLNDLNKNYVEFNGDLSLRLFKGFSLSLKGRMALIHNQIELPKGDRTDEEVYLRLRELETNYRYDLGIGLKYTFGSIYSNIVNPRF